MDSDLKEIVCCNPHCSNLILRKGSDGSWRFSIKSMKTEGANQPLIAICKSCKTEVKTPFLLVPMGAEQVSNEGLAKEKNAPARKSFSVEYRGGFAVMSYPKSK